MSTLKAEGGWLKGKGNAEPLPHKIPHVTFIVPVIMFCKFLRQFQSSASASETKVGIELNFIFSLRQT